MATYCTCEPRVRENAKLTANAKRCSTPEERAAHPGLPKVVSIVKCLNCRKERLNEWLLRTREELAKDELRRAQLVVNDPQKGTGGLDKVKAFLLALKL